MGKYIRIINWERFQHYKDRNPPWIKLHRDLMTSETWVSSSNDDRVLAIAIMMLAAATGNQIPANTRYIQRVAYLDKEPDLSALISVNFIEYIEENGNASKPLADARPETETETEGETDTEANASGTVVPHPAADFCKAVFDSGVSLLVRAGKKPDAARSLIGRWRKTIGDPELLTLIRQSEVEGHSDPAAWLTAAVETRNGNRNHDSAASALDQLVIANSRDRTG